LGAGEQDTKNIRNLSLGAIRNFITGTGHSSFKILFKGDKGLLQRLKCMWTNESSNPKYTHKFIPSQDLSFLYCSPHLFTIQCSKLLLQKIIPQLIKTFKLVWQTNFHYHITQTASDPYHPDGSSQQSLISHAFKNNIYIYIYIKFVRPHIV